MKRIVSVVVLAAALPAPMIKEGVTQIAGDLVMMGLAGAVRATYNEAQ